MTQGEYQPPAIVSKLEDAEQSEFWICDECEDGLTINNTRIILNDNKLICKNCLIELSLTEFIEERVSKIYHEKH